MLSARGVKLTPAKEYPLVGPADRLRSWSGWRWALWRVWTCLYIRARGEESRRPLAAPAGQLMKNDAAKAARPNGISLTATRRFPASP